MLVYYKNQTELAEAIKNIIDDYWNLDIEQDIMIETLRDIAKNNKEILYKEEDYVAIVRQRLGVKRLRVLDSILEREK